MLCLGVTFEVFVLLPVHMEVSVVKTPLVINSRVVFNHACDLSSCLNKEFGSEISYISESLDNNFLSLNALFKTSFLVKGRSVQHLSASVIDT